MHFVVDFFSVFSKTDVVCMRLHKISRKKIFWCQQCKMKSAQYFFFVRFSHWANYFHKNGLKKSLKLNKLCILHLNICLDLSAGSSIYVTASKTAWISFSSLFNKQFNFWADTDHLNVECVRALCIRSRSRSSFPRFNFVCTFAHILLCKKYIFYIIEIVSENE